MFEGFLAGTLTLVALYVVTQTKVADKLGLASSTFAQGLKRLTSPQVAGVGNHIHAATSSGTPASPSATTAQPSTGIYYT